MPISDTCSKDKQVLCRRGRYEQLSTTPKQMSMLLFEIQENNKLISRVPLLVIMMVQMLRSWNMKKEA